MTMRTQTVGVPRSGGFGGPRRALLATIGGVTALAIATGIVAWRASDSGSGTRATPIVPPPTTTAQWLDTPLAAPLFIYLVATEAEAEALQRAIVAEPLAEQPPVRVFAVAAEPGAGAHRMDALIEDVRASEIELGRPLPTIMDLRG